jgi:hypothetical protein
MTGELRSSLKVHGGPDGSNAIIRDCAVADLGDGRWEVVSVGYDRKVQITR